MHELYNIVSIFVTGGLLFACGVVFLFAAIPDSPLLGNYRKARYLMAGAYLFFVAAGMVEYLFQASPPDVSDAGLMQTVTLAIAASQALLFTLALLALLDVRFPGWPYIFRKVAYVLLFVAAIFASYLFCPAETFRVAFYVFSAIYALLLMRYTLLFLRSYRQFQRRMDNYFSDMEADRLRWVAFSFFAALAVGIMALLSSLFMSTLVALLFTVGFDTFYLFFAIRFINYRFHAIERAMNDETPAPPAETPYVASLPSAAPPAPSSSDVFARIDRKIEEWITNKHFTQQGITLDALAARLHTNSKYLSVYINTCKKQTFREWINALRIEEAKTLLLQHPGITVNEIARRLGFSDKSHFLRQFKKRVNLSTSDWKKRAAPPLFPVSAPPRP
jgi:AraC-like DNA-binding protein